MTEFVQGGVSPPLAQAARDPKFPVTFSAPLKDPDYATPYGPYAGVGDADGYDATFHVLQYVDEMEAPDPPDVKVHPTVQVALDRLRTAARGKFRSPDTYVRERPPWHSMEFMPDTGNPRSPQRPIAGISGRPRRREKRTEGAPAVDVRNNPPFMCLQP